MTKMDLQTILMNDLLPKQPQRLLQTVPPLSVSQHAQVFAQKVAKKTFDDEKKKLKFWSKTARELLTLS